MNVRIALDAMGSDHGASVPVAAAIRAITEHNIPVTLVGDRNVISSLVEDQISDPTLLEIVDAPETVSMEDEAIAAVRRKRRASIPVGMELLKSGAAEAFVSGGNTGAVVASSVIGLGRLDGVNRPGIAAPLPTLTGGEPMWLIDAGALIDARALNMHQHARLASAYLASITSKTYPRIGLISNGEEAGKGTALVREVHALLHDDPEINFVGNIEPKALPDDVCDIAVTDGYTGNVVLKTAEGMSKLITETLRGEFRRRIITSVLALLLRPAFRRAGRTLDYREYGGAPLLGINGLVYIAHGSSDSIALVNAIRAAYQAADNDTLNKINRAFARPSHVHAS